jgi:ribonuclease HII
MEEEKTKPKRVRKIQEPLQKCFTEDNSILEIGVDEAGRGPLFGRVYTGAVILPKDSSFRHEDMKDSKKFTSEKKIQEVAEYIKKNAVAWSVTWEDEKSIDKINIRNATHKSMHHSIRNIMNDQDEINDQCEINEKEYKLLIDGNDFKPFLRFRNDTLEPVSHICITGGDNTYSSIAAASILAKTTRDEYIHDLCEKNPKLIEYYNLKKNKGYGTKHHLDGIKKYGISDGHRLSYAPCKNYCLPVINLEV